MKDNRVLIDTSVWIDYFKGRGTKLVEKTDEMLSDADIYVPKIVLAELMQGAGTDKELSVIEDFFEAFHIIDQSDDTWTKAGKLSFSMKRKGTTIHLTDCYIAMIAFENGCSIFSIDDHFKSIKKFLNIQLIA